MHLTKLLKAICFFIILIPSAQATVLKESMRELLEIKRTSSKVDSYYRRRAKLGSNNHYHTRERKIYNHYNAINRYVKKFHKHALVKGQLGHINGAFDDQKADDEISNFVVAMSNALEELTRFDRYDRTSKNYKFKLSKISFHLTRMAEYMRENDVRVAIPKVVSDLSAPYKKQFEFLEYKAELLADMIKYQEALEVSLEALEDHLGDFIRRNHGHHKKNHHRHRYTRASAPYVKHRNVVREAQDLIEDLDINEVESYFELHEEMLKLESITKSDKTNTLKAKILVSEVTHAYNTFIKEVRTQNSAINIRTLESTLGVKEAEFKYYRATQVCSLLGGPGNIILRKSHESDIDLFTDFSPRTSGAIKLIEHLKFNDIELSYRHAEVVTEIEKDTRITTMGFYPLSFNWGKDEIDRMPPFLEIKKGYRKCNSEKCDTYNDYRTNFAWLEVVGSSNKKIRTRKEDSLKKIAKKEKYSKMGVCSDFVNWTFGNVISSNWNKIPVVKNVIQFIYPPEGLQTPDNLYDSHMTRPVCEVESRKLKYPARVNVHELVGRLREDTRSNNEMIRNHAQKNLELLMKKNIINPDFEEQIDILTFKTK